MSLDENDGCDDDDNGDAGEDDGQMREWRRRKIPRQGR
jgi:hypothetical protein